MKQLLFTGACFTLLTLSVVSCKTEPKTVTEEKVIVAEENLKEAKKAATAEEWKEFKEKTDAMIEQNKIQLIELRSKMRKAKASMDSDYEENVAELEQKNNELKATLEQYKNDSDSDWESFKIEFNHDADELGLAIKDFTVNNTKK
jgi:predicted RNase H-like nuclease (RuvC/YqgF family)